MPSTHRPIFCRKQLQEKIGLLCVTIIGEVPLLDDVTPIFSRTEVSAHRPILCRKQLREKIGVILFRSKSQPTRTDFHSYFLLFYDKKISACALGISRLYSRMFLSNDCLTFQMVIYLVLKMIHISNITESEA